MRISGDDDEAILRDMNHPDHFGGVREGSKAAGMLFLAGVVFFNVVEVTWLSQIWKILILLFLSTAIGIGVLKYFRKSLTPKGPISLQEIRENLSAEREKQMDEMRRSNATNPKGERTK